ncbi:unnamed protein product [Phaedon cochleariae]|uniref:Uncharacterized protein n=1 Tax=Phaedon cochleariae TaxID=80249 RepID=A0A9N9X1E7_PHACE|nr:unnamed protein product [Phaedon cochleariae]
MITEGEDMKNEIVRLQKENLQKDVYIQRLKRTSTSFEEDVFSAEQNFVKKLDDQKHIITDLNKEIIGQTEINRNLVKKVDLLSSDQILLRKEIHNLESSNQKLKISIESITQENELYITELSKLRKENELCTIQIDVLKNETHVPKTGKVDSLENEILKVELKSLKAELTGSSSRNTYLDKEIYALQMVNDNFEKELSSLIDENAKLNQEVTRLENYVSQLSERSKHNEIMDGTPMSRTEKHKAIREEVEFPDTLKFMKKIEPYKKKRTMLCLDLDNTCNGSRNGVAVSDEGEILKDDGSGIAEDKADKEADKSDGNNLVDETTPKDYLPAFAEVTTSVVVP